MIILFNVNMVIFLRKITKLVNDYLILCEYGYLSEKDYEIGKAIADFIRNRILFYFGDGGLFF